MVYGRAPMEIFTSVIGRTIRKMDLAFTTKAIICSIILEGGSKI
jgi:hypothetical protein